VEFFRADEAATDYGMRENFVSRAARYPDGHLDFVLHRVGLLGPEPGGLAIWTFRGYAAAEPIIRERHGDNPLRPLAAGLYFDFEEALV
jgi:hypothetical protein